MIDTTRLNTMIDALYQNAKTRRIYQCVGKQLLDATPDKPFVCTSQGRWLQARSISKRMIENGVVAKDYAFPGLDSRFRTKKGSTQSRIRTKVIPEDRFEEILENLPQTRKGKRLYLCCLLAYYSGLRRGETLAFQLSWLKIQKDGGADIVIPANHAKFKETHSTFFPKTHLDMLRRLSEDTQHVVISNNYLGCTFNRIVRALFPDNEYSFHALRHSCATRWHEHGIDSVDIQLAFGHANIQTTISQYIHPSQKKPKRLEELGY